MLTLGEAQWQALRKIETRNFVSAVCEQFLGRRPELLLEAGKDEVLGRMLAGHDLAARIGLQSTPHIVKLLYLCADAPQLAVDEEVQMYLLRPGASPEQRLDDLSAVIAYVLNEMGKGIPPA